MELSYKEIRAQICDVCHKMWQLGWVAANDGNISVFLNLRADRKTVSIQQRDIHQRQVKPVPGKGLVGFSAGEGVRDAKPLGAEQTYQIPGDCLIVFNQKNP